MAMNGPRSELQAKMPNLRDEPLKAGCRGKQKYGLPVTLDQNDKKLEINQLLS